MLELVSSAMLKGTQDLGLSVLSYASSRSQTSLINLIPNVQMPFTETQCLDVSKSIEDAIYGGRLPTDTYSDNTMDLVAKLVRRGRRTTIITIAGSVSNGNFDNPSSSIYTPGKIADAITKIEMKVGDPSLVNFFAVGYIGSKIGNNEATKANYRMELKSLADKNRQRVVVNSNQIELYNDMLQLLRSEGVMCSTQRKFETHNTVVTNLFWQIIVKYTIMLCLLLNIVSSKEHQN